VIQSKTNLLCGVSILLMVGCVSLSAQSSTAQEEKNKTMALNWWRDVVANGRLDSASNYMADDYVEHDPNIGGGRKEFAQYYGHSAARANPNAKPVMSFGKGDYAVLVWEHDDKDAGGKPIKYNTYDILLARNGKIQEHWNDVKRNDSALESVSQPASGQPPAESLKNSPEEQKNEQFVLNMYRDVLQYHHFELAPKYMAADYIQHNALDPQGRDPLIHELSERFKPEPLQPEMKNKPALVITKGAIVLMMTSRPVKDAKDASKTYTQNHFEMIRVQHGLAQEHWDSSVGPGGSRN
jgi:predicted SnoaL-like aldol condensation-catalyzing enzyme